ncbi:hypothetical protein [Nitratiruptor tergarcus]|uniref:Uncharacterized conserved protein n=1 Tax=Nitratiruptor tergarcus DSM 16512 TaxID=1069081 RepID=A0A1W1WRN2_9BACT|nr:hypothetical protein [Nitratiruptor tergarcus]SMC08865.1 Uncharacterized conserved protein [Nitratiruptor tergarcus DSM 16512]
MIRFVFLFLLGFGYILASSLPPYVEGLGTYLLSKEKWKIYGTFYQYDFEQNGSDYNDWLYISDQGSAFRLLGITPTDDNPFGWKRLNKAPSQLPEIAGYFIFIQYDGDSETRFSWVYLSQNSQSVYKLMGADPNTHYFQYLDIDNDGSPDRLPYIWFTINDDNTATFHCSIVPGTICPYSSSSSSAPSSSSTSIPTSSSSSCASDSCNLDCAIGSHSSGAASSVPASRKIGRLDTPFQWYNAQVKIYEISSTGSLNLRKTTHTYHHVGISGFIFDFCDGAECSMYHNNSYYLVEVNKGCDFDPNGNGQLEQFGNKNKGVLRLIVKGDEISHRPVVSLISEIAYENLASYIKYRFHPLGFQEQLRTVAKSLFTHDITGDSNIDEKDIAFYQDLQNKGAVTPTIAHDLTHLYVGMRDGKYPSMILNSTFDTEYVNIPLYGNAVCVHGNRAYIGNNNKLIELDISDPTHITKVRERILPSSHNINAIIVYSSQKLAVATSHGLYFVNTSNLSYGRVAPIYTNFIDLAKDSRNNIWLIDRTKFYKYDASQNKILQSTIPLDFANDIKIVDKNGVTFAIIANGTEGVKIINLYPRITPTHQQKFIFDIDTPGHANAVDVKGNNIYVADGQNGIVVIDFQSRSIVGHANTFDYTCDITIDGSYAYVADYASGLIMFDLSTPTHPAMSGYIDILYNACKVTKLFKNGKKLAFVYRDEGTQRGINIIDVSNPYYRDITLSGVVSRITEKGSTIKSIAKRGSILYALSEGKLFIYSIAPNKVFLNKLTEFIINQSPADWTDIALSNHLNHLYISSNKKGLIEVDITNPVQPQSVGIYPVQSTYTDATQLILNSDSSKAFLADFSKVHILRLWSTPAYLEEHLLNVPGTINYIAISEDGTKLFVTYQTFATYQSPPVYKTNIYDITSNNTLSPSFIGTITYNQNEYVYGAIQFHDASHLLTFSTWMKYYDITNLNAPRLIESSSAYPTVVLHIAGNDYGYRIYGITKGYGLDVFDRTKYKGCFNTFGTTDFKGGRKAVRNGNIFYIPDGRMGTNIIDVNLFAPHDQ